jgi:hypothetical protein
VQVYQAVTSNRAAYIQGIETAVTSLAANPGDPNAVSLVVNQLTGAAEAVGALYEAVNDAITEYPGYAAQLEAQVGPVVQQAISDVTGSFQLIQNAFNHQPTPTPTPTPGTSAFAGTYSGTITSTLPPSAFTTPISVTIQSVNTSNGTATGSVSIPGINYSANFTIPAQVSADGKTLELSGQPDSHVSLQATVSGDTLTGQADYTNGSLAVQFHDITLAKQA